MSDEQNYQRSFPEGSPWLDEHCKKCGVGANFHVHQLFCGHGDCPYKPEKPMPDNTEEKQITKVELGCETDLDSPRGRAASVLRLATRKGVKLRAYTGDIGILLDEIASEIAGEESRAL